MTIHETARFLAQSDSVYVLTHRRPDGDTVGSAAALCEGLRSMGKNSYAVKNPDITDRYLPFLRSYLWEGQLPEAAVFVSVDVAQPSLLPESMAPLAGRLALVIDHHVSNDGFTAPLCVYPERAATGEVVYEILMNMGAPLTKELALPLYLALSTDTGCFQYANTTPETHRIAAELIGAGIAFDVLNLEMFGVRTLPRFRLESLALEGLELLDGGTIALIFLSRSVLEKARASQDDTDDISGLPRKIAGVEIGVTFKESKENVWRISVRTSGRFAANRICAQLGGGGHARASGCEYVGPLEEARARLLAAVEEVKRAGGGHSDS